MTDLRVFSPDEADPASGPAMEALIPGSMKPEEAYWPKDPSSPPVCIVVPSVEEVVCTPCTWSNGRLASDGGTLRLRKRYALGSITAGSKLDRFQFGDGSGHCPGEFDLVGNESGHCPDVPKCCWRALRSSEK